MRLALLAFAVGVAFASASIAQANPILLQAFKDCENWVSKGGTPKFGIKLNKMQLDARRSKDSELYLSPEFAFSVKIQIAEDKSLTARSCEIEAVDVSRGAYFDRLKRVDVGATWNRVETLPLDDMRKTLEIIASQVTQDSLYIENPTDGYKSHGDNSFYFWCGPNFRLISLYPDGVSPIATGRFHKWTVALQDVNTPANPVTGRHCPTG